jgi:hypothetical protein
METFRVRITAGIKTGHLCRRDGIAAMYTFIYKISQYKGSPVEPLNRNEQRHLLLVGLECQAEGITQ